MSRSTSTLRRRRTRILLASAGLCAAVGFCVPACSDSDDSTGTSSSALCQGSDQAFVRRTMLAIGGRRPTGQAEVNAYEDAIGAIRFADGYGDPNAPQPRAVIARVIMADPSFLLRWEDFFMDTMLVGRNDSVKVSEYDIGPVGVCYGPPRSTPPDGGDLAKWVLEHSASDQDPPLSSFQMGDLLASALELDNISPVYLAHLFAMLNFPLPAANVDPLEGERARRLDFGSTFDTAYIHRDQTCLHCHNSETSVTYNPDPALNRAWPVPGFFERALYGASNGEHPPQEAATKGTDELRAISMLRFQDVNIPLKDGTSPQGIAPYGWDWFSCGLFEVPTTPDPLGVDTYFASIHATTDDPNKGLMASVWNLEQSLRHGFDSLSKTGLQVNSDGTISDPDAAFAYLVAENISERVWTEVIGSPLTIGNYFPRTAEQRDILKALTDHFIATHYSLKTLLLDIVLNANFNLLPPEAGCGDAPYSLPRIFNPWTNADIDPAKRGNSSADGIYPISSRPLRRSFHTAMGWPPPADFPKDDPMSPDPAAQELTFQSQIGEFIRAAEPGFRGLDFEGRLVWERRYGSCPKLSDPDFITELSDLAAKTPGATVGDAVIALKDRLLGEPWISDSEKPGLEGLIGTTLGDTKLGSLDTQLRAVCGAFAASPQFMLGGLSPVDSRTVPKLVATDASYDAACKTIAHRLGLLGEPYKVSCEPGRIVVSR